MRFEVKRTLVQNPFRKVSERPHSVVVESAVEERDQRGDRFSFSVEWNRGREQKRLKSNSLTRLDSMLAHDMLYHGALASLLSHQGVPLPRIVSLDDEQMAYGFQKAAREIQETCNDSGYLTTDYFSRLERKLCEYEQKSAKDKARLLRLRATQAVLAMEVAGLQVSRLLLKDAPLTALLKEESSVRATITNEAGEGVRVRIESAEDSSKKKNELRLNILPPARRHQDKKLRSHFEALKEAVEQPFGEWLFSESR